MRRHGDGGGHCVVGGRGDSDGGGDGSDSDISGVVMGGRGDPVADNIADNVGGDGDDDAGDDGDSGCHVLEFYPVGVFFVTSLYVDRGCETVMRSQHMRGAVFLWCFGSGGAAG